MIRTRAIVVVLAAAFAVSAPHAQIDDTYRAQYGDAGKVRGPLSDFWFKVRSEWSGYLQLDPGPPTGGGFLRQRTLQTAAPNRVWVSLVHSDLSSEQYGQPLRHLYKEFLSEWRRAEGRNWPYAQIYDRTWDRMGAIGRKQNIIMIGTPWALDPVGPLAEGLGFSIGPGRIDIGKRKYRGDNLILIFIAPNPENPEKYAMVITGSSEEAILQAGHLPYGETDYVIFRGRRLLESGHFMKSDRSAWARPESYQAHGSHRGFAIRESTHYTFWYEPDRMPREDLESLVAEKEEGYPALAALLPPHAVLPPRITYYLYPTVDRKIDETARDDISHVDLAAAEIHTVYSRTQRVVEPYLDLMVMLHRAIGPTRVPRLERALAIAMAPRFQGRDVASLAARIFAGTNERDSTVLRSLRDQDVMTAADGPPSALDLLLTGFLEDLVARFGRQRALDFVARASPRDLDDAFQDVYDRDMGDTLHDWTASLRDPKDGAREQAAPPSPPRPAPASGAADTDYGRAVALMKDRRDDEAIRLIEEVLRDDPRHPGALTALARLRFRRGDFDDAEQRARDVIAACDRRPQGDAGGCPEAEAWGRLTLGRVEAVRGAHVAARVELTHPAVAQGPAPVPTLADYWLITMGESRNQLTVVSHLKREARVSLRKLDWRSAEQDLNKALEIDPTDGEAHRLLSEVYHKQHEYWAWRVRYLNEIHPDYNIIGRIYQPDADNPLALRVESLHSLDSFNDLVLKGNLELLKAQSLYAVEIQNLHAEGDRFLIEMHDIHEALKVYLRALDLNRDFFLSHFLVGRCYFLMDRHDDARRAFEEVLRRQPRDPLVVAWTHNYLGYIALEEDDLAEAKHRFERSIAAGATGKVAELAREGLGKVETIRLLLPRGNGRR